MIKDILEANEKVRPLERQIEALKGLFPGCFATDGSLDFEELKRQLLGKVSIRNEGYGLNFLGKSYARLLASLDTTTVITPDKEHNEKPENKDSDNLYISGDNIDALKHLLKSYEGQIKCIYIDPPYNTGSDGFVYNDKFSFTVQDLIDKLSIDEEEAAKILDLTKRKSASHSAWLLFMYPRLQLARDLLTEDGVIFISIDDNEQADLKLLCDEIFGEENFLTCITRATGTPTGGGFDGIVNEMDYLLVYSFKLENAVINGLEMSGEDAEIYNQIDSTGHRYLTRSLRRTGGEDRKEDRPTMYYPIIDPDGETVYPIGPTGYESRWICGPDKYKYLLENDLIEWKKIKKQGKLEWHPYQKFYLENRSKKPGNIWQSFFTKQDDFHSFLWNDIEGNKKATRDIRSLFDGKKVFETAKPVELLEKILKISCNKDDKVLDFFGGSSTSAHAVLNINQKFGLNLSYIMIQLEEATSEESEARKCGYQTIDQIGMARIERAAKKLKEEYPDTPADLGFRHYTLQDVDEKVMEEMYDFNPMSSNDLFVHNDLYQQFGKDTILTTWLVRDGYHFAKVSEVRVMDLAGYKGYYMGHHLYLIDPGCGEEAVQAIFDAYEEDASFRPTHVVVFGYNFTWTELENLKNNLLHFKDVEDNLRISVDVRY